MRTRILKLFGLVLALLSASLLGLAVITAIGQAGEESEKVPIFDGLFVSGTSQNEEDIATFRNNVKLLRDALHKGKGWENGRAVVQAEPSWTDLKRKIGERKDVKAGHVFVFLFSGHGGRRADINGDEAGEKDKEDEYILLKNNKANQVLDDDLGIPFLPAQQSEGKRILVFLSCYSEGLWDGKLDKLKNLPRSILIGSVDENGRGKFSPKAKISLVGLMLLGGLTEDPANRGFAKADTNHDGTVTVQEWFDFAARGVRSFGDELNKIVDEIARILEVIEDEVTSTLKGSKLDEEAKADYERILASVKKGKKHLKVMRITSYPKMKANDLNPNETPIFVGGEGKGLTASKDFTDKKVKYREGYERVKEKWEKVFNILNR